MSVPRHTTPPTPRDLEAEIAAVCFAITRVLPPGVAWGFIEGLQLAAKAQKDGGHTNAGTYLEGLAAALPAVMPKGEPGH